MLVGGVTVLQALDVFEVGVGVHLVLVARGEGDGHGAAQRAAEEQHLAWVHDVAALGEEVVEDGLRWAGSGG